MTASVKRLLKSVDLCAKVILKLKLARFMVHGAESVLTENSRG